MHISEAVDTAYFWIYTASALAVLAGAWYWLYRRRRQGQPLEEYHQAFWSWAFLVGAALLTILLGLEVFVLVVALVSLFACREFARATGLYRDLFFTGLVYVAILAVNAVALWAGLASAPSADNRGYDVFMATPIYAVALVCLLPVLRNRSEGMLPLVALAVMAFVYFGYFLAHLSLLAGAAAPAVYGYLYFLLLGTWTAEVVGWLAGRGPGRRPLAPRISTEITWQGTVGSVLWGFVWSFGLGWTLPQFGWWALVLAALLFGVVGPLGDLAMRYILHDFGLKEPEARTLVVPYRALEHFQRLVFVAPFFFRLVHLVHPDLWTAAAE